ncbi:MAG: cupin domain-containing protein [Woeseia sp.]|nr:cupin domain-containing protein [Woeseia sp.]MBT8098076.1 cupin domain-containing protein [Woeseia sp.]NNE60972.1 cupin domain-containing protein [Woeseia sp.]NNL54031.1 cupin domain-containing protein [Woeseia sp.]
MTEELGKRLAAVRKSKGLSQRELAKRAGVTNSTISLIEQDRVSPSVSSLKKVLDGFPMTMAEFFTLGDGEDRRAVFFPRDEQPNVGQGAVEYYLVGAGLPQRKIAMLREVYGVGADTGDEMILHDGDESGVVISGTIELTVGDEVSVLGAGDGYYFDCRLPHRFRNVGKEEVVIVSANHPPSF